MFLDPEILTGLGILLGGIGTGVVGGKKLPFWKKNGNGKSQGCPDPSCHNEVMNTSKSVAELKADFKEFKKDAYPKINTTATDVAEIKGYIKGLHNGNGNHR